jgi:hypothetical protein
VTVDWEKFWTVMLGMLIWVPLILMWTFALADLFRRADLSGWRKLVWLVVIVLLPIFGVVVYFLFKPAATWATYGYEDSPDVRQGMGGSSSEKLSSLAELRSSGVINEEQYQRGRSNIMGAGSG